jgi:hypothetical protein
MLKSESGHVLCFWLVLGRVCRFVLESLLRRGDKPGNFEDGIAHNVLHIRGNMQTIVEEPRSR